jgi:MiaB-like tRNA modifying enzyme
VPISEGCLGYCSYCAARIARGRLRSYPAEHIIKEIEECIRDGFKEIQLTAQDTGVYGFDIGSNLPNLLKRISKIDGDFRVRVGMMNPGYTRKIMRELIEAFRSRKIYKFIHVPVQSGDNTVLKDMKRNYSVNDFVELVTAFKRAFSDVVLSTDIIVGYPTETEESFTKSVELVEKIKPDIINITRFSKREGTEAYGLKDLPGWIKKERSRLLTEIHRRIGEDINRQFLGREFEVLITKKGKNGTFLARTDSYRPVVVKSGKIGEFVRVEITDCNPYYLVGELLS